jgi:RND family efflux transporter MFP subunit
MKKGFLFKSTRVIVVLFLSVVVAAALVVMRPRAQRQEKPFKGHLVEVMEIQREDVSMVVETFGTVKPREVLRLVSEVRGQIVSIHPAFKEGGFVETGHLLMEVDPRSYRLEVARNKILVIQAQAEIHRLAQHRLNLEASIEIADSSTKLVHAEFMRLKKLNAKDVVAQTSLDKAEQRYLETLDRNQTLKNQMALIGPVMEQARAQLRMAENRLDYARLELQRTRIVALFDGWVLEKVVEKGEHVNAGQLLGSLYHNGLLDVEVRLSVEDLKWLPSDILKGALPEATIFFGSEDLPVGQWKGHIARAKARVDERTRMLPVVVEAEYSSGPEGDTGFSVHKQLLPGMFVTVTINGINVKGAMVLPRNLIHGNNSVYLFKEGRLEKRKVTILRRHKDSVFITGGLAQGEKVIRTPLPDAVDGMLLRLADS